MSQLTVDFDSKSHSKQYETHCCKLWNKRSQLHQGNVVRGRHISRKRRKHMCANTFLGCVQVNCGIREVSYIDTL